MARLVRGGKNNMYAVIETGGKQYRVQQGDVITVEKLDVAEGKKVKFDKVLVLSDDKETKVGTPYLDCAVEGKVVENGKGQKVVIFKYKAKKDYRKKQGHRQPFTKVEILSLGVEGEKKAPAKKAEPKAEAKAEAKEIKVSSSMKKDELLEVAKQLGVEVDAKATKADILAAIQAK